MEQRRWHITWVQRNYVRKQIYNWNLAKLVEKISVSINSTLFPKDFFSPSGAYCLLNKSQKLSGNQMICPSIWINWICLQLSSEIDTHTHDSFMLFGSSFTCDQTFSRPSQTLLMLSLVNADTTMLNLLKNVSFSLVTTHHFRSVSWLSILSFILHYIHIIYFVKQFDFF